MKAKATFYFLICVNNFYPWKDIVGKKVSKLKVVKNEKIGGVWVVSIDRPLIRNISADFKIFF
jgi:hypothetical protein